MPKSTDPTVKIEAAQLARLKELCAGIRPAPAANALVREAVAAMITLLETPPAKRTVPSLVAQVDAIGTAKAGKLKG